MLNYQKQILAIWSSIPEKTRSFWKWVAISMPGQALLEPQWHTGGPSFTLTLTLASSGDSENWWFLGYSPKGKPLLFPLVSRKNRVERPRDSELLSHTETENRFSYPLIIHALCKGTEYCPSQFPCSGSSLLRSIQSQRKSSWHRFELWQLLWDRVTLASSCKWVLEQCIKLPLEKKIVLLLYRIMRSKSEF